MTDEMHRTGQRELAVKHAIEALNRTISGEMPDDVPHSILLKWKVQNEKALFLKMSIFMGCQSSYFSKSKYEIMFRLWRDFEPSNPEACLRSGLFMALCAQRKGIDVSSEAMELLRYDDLLGTQSCLQ